MPSPLTIRLPRPLAAARAVAGPTGTPAGASPEAHAAGPSAGATGPEAVRRADAEREQLHQARQALMDAVTKFHQLQDELLRQSEKQVVDLAVDIARKILMREIEAGRYDIEPVVAEALKRLPGRRDVVVHLNPEDWSRCTVAQRSEGLPESQHVSFVSDPSVRRAECVIEGPEGVVESAVETQLGGIADALRALR